MKILFDLGHAAHVHLFRQMMNELKQNGHHITVVSRDKPHVLALLDSYGIEHLCLSKPGKGLAGLFAEWLLRTWQILRLNQQHQFDLAIGTSVSISYLSLFGKTVSVNVQEDDDAVIPLHVLLAYPLSSYIVNPSVLKYKYFSSKRLLHRSLHEMAYLSLATFNADLQVLNKYKLQPYQYIIVRKVKLDAHHDVGQSGLSNRHLEVIDKRGDGYDILHSNEVGSQKIAVTDMHHLLSYARLLITDSQTMAAEAACLATPVIQVSSFKDKLSYIGKLIELELIQAMAPDCLEDFDVALTKNLENTNSVQQRTKQRSEINTLFPDFTKEFFTLLRENHIADLP
ncbi:MAG: DUF354 domain-containing protein [Gammaproteobacteria bacterium]|nr:DUF354 domain-containing protein [Gammaproteobacteria bacterium]